MLRIFELCNNDDRLKKQDSCNVLTNLIRLDFIPLGHTSHEQSPKSNLKGDLSEDNGLKLKYCV